MPSYKPPIINRWYLGICKWGLPLELARSQTTVFVAEDGINRFLKLRGERCVIVCNHSDQYDPEVVFTFSKLAREDFHFMAAREVFDWFGGAAGWFLQNIGCYSVARGQADTEAFKETKKLIAHGQRKLVIFPEGEVTRQPDVILPLRRGSARLFLEAQAELSGAQENRPVYVLPIGIRWRYTHDITGWMSLIVRALEVRLKIKSSSGNLVQRVHAAAAALASALEREYCSSVHADLPFEERIQLLRTHILTQISSLVSVHKPKEGSHIVWLRRNLNAIKHFVSDDNYTPGSYQHRLHLKACAKLRPFLSDLVRVQHLVGVKTPPHHLPMTQERLAGMLTKIEREVFGFGIPKGRRVAIVAIGEPFPLAEYGRRYGSQPEKVIEEVTAQMATRLQGLVDYLDALIIPKGVAVMQESDAMSEIEAGLRESRR